MLTQLFAYIQTISVLSEKSQRILESALITKHLSKGTFLLKEREICKAVFFINTGCCRAFHVVDGLEINTNFFVENDFVTNIKSLTQNQKSEYAIQACEPMSVVMFNKEKLLEAYRQSPEIETFGRKLLEQLVAKGEAHADRFKLLTAQQRYAYLQSHQPVLLQRLSLTHLSSYLGISRETLSRIRNRNSVQK